MSFRIQTGTGTFPATGVPVETQKAGPQHIAAPGALRVPDALEDLRSQPADGADFSAIATAAAAGQALDHRYLKMAGEPVVPSSPLPAVLAEQHARYVLDSTLALINELAAELLAHSHGVFASGSLEERAALALTLKRFLAQAQATMVGLVASSRAELTAAPSADMSKLLTFCSHGLWQGLDALGLQLRNTFERQVMTAEGPVQPSPAQREQACARLVADQSMQFKRQMDAIQLSSVKRPGFDPAALVGVVAMRAELATAIAGIAGAGGAAGVAAQPAAAFVPYREPGHAPPSSPASSTSDGLVDDAFFAGLNDRDDFDADGLDGEPDVNGDPVRHIDGDNGGGDEMDTDDRYS